MIFLCLSDFPVTDKTKAYQTCKLFSLKMVAADALATAVSLLAERHWRPLPLEQVLGKT